MGSLMSDARCQPRYAQLYIYDTKHEIENRIACVSRGREESSRNNTIVLILKTMLDYHNKYVKKVLIC